MSLKLLILNVQNQYLHYFLYYTRNEDKQLPTLRSAILQPNLMQSTLLASYFSKSDKGDRIDN